jgi:hypothetical protein
MPEEVTRHPSGQLCGGGCWTTHCLITPAALGVIRREDGLERLRGCVVAGGGDNVRRSVKGKDPLAHSCRSTKGSSGCPEAPCGHRRERPGACGGGARRRPVRLSAL